ncbi:MAG: hypothetical protein RR272_00610 [Synergistaceae bacterium]
MICQLTGTNAIGRMLLPMFLPVILGSLLLPRKFAIIIALMTPIMNNILKGLPPVPLLYFITLELGIYALVANFLRDKLQMRLTILISFILGRGFYIIALLFVVKIMGLHIDNVLFYSLLMAVPVSIPAIILQIIFVPMIYNKSVMVLNSGR